MKSGSLHRRAFVALLGGAAILGRVPARAQDAFKRGVTIIVPLTPGNALNSVARVMGGKLAEQLGASVVIENLPGGGTVIGAAAAAKSAPDGSTLMLAPSGTLTTNLALYKKLPYDPLRDFVPVALVARVPFVLVVHSALPVGSLAELIDYAKARPRQLSYGSSGIGTANHLATELMNRMAGIEMVYVPYRGPSLALADVVAGHIQVLFSDPSTSLPMIEDGRVRALAVSSTTRMAASPSCRPSPRQGCPGSRRCRGRCSPRPRT